MGLIIACLLGLVLVLLFSATYWRGVLKHRNALIDTCNKLDAELSVTRTGAGAVARELSWYKNLVHNRSEGAPQFGTALVGHKFAFVALPMTRSSLAVLGARSRAARPPRRKRTTLQTITRAGK